MPLPRRAWPAEVITRPAHRGQLPKHVAGSDREASALQAPMQSRWRGWECPLTADGARRGQERAPLSSAPLKMGGGTGSTKHPAQAHHVWTAGNAKPPTRTSQRWILTMGVSEGSAHAPAHQQWTRLAQSHAPLLEECPPRHPTDPALPPESAFPGPTKHICSNLTESRSPHQLEFPKSAQHSSQRGIGYVFRNCGNVKLRLLPCPRVSRPGGAPVRE